jgi:DHA1 family multidrug resistance protein-like MFS transporter
MDPRARHPPVTAGTRSPFDAETAGGVTRSVRYLPSVTGQSTRPAQDWRILVAIFWVTQLVESMGVSQVFALLPSYLRELGVPDADRLAFVGLYGSLVFLLGLPLVPLWGVWADKYSRKAVIVRSALVEVAVFGLAALAREPWMLAVAVLGIGFQLGNTGVMLAAIRDVTPLRRVGTTIAIFGAAGPIGFATGPALAGLLIDGAGWSISGVFALSAVLSLGTALLVTLGTHEVRPAVIPEGRTLTLAFGAMRSVLGDPVVRRLFLVYGLVFLANQVSRPYTPVLVEEIVGAGTGLATSIGVVMGAASLVGALVAPVAGYLGDRIGFRPVLVVALAGGAVASLLMPLMPALAPLAGAALLLGAAAATTGAMVFSLLATEVPVERRSQTLNLVYLPLYVAGLIGPAVGAALAAVAGPHGPFIAGAVVFAVGAIAVALMGTVGTPRRPRESTASFV